VLDVFSILERFSLLSARCDAGPGRLRQKQQNQEKASFRGLRSSG
jgi:hypothetical protein